MARRASAASPRCWRRRARRSSPPPSTATQQAGASPIASRSRSALAARPFAPLAGDATAAGRGCSPASALQVGVTVEHLRTSDDDADHRRAAPRRSAVDVPLYGGADARAAWRCGSYGRLMVTPDGRRSTADEQPCYEPIVSGAVLRRPRLLPVSAAAIDASRRARDLEPSPGAGRRGDGRRRCGARRSRPTSRSGATTRARSSTPTGGWSRRRRTSRCTSARRRCRCARCIDRADARRRRGRDRQRSLRRRHPPARRHAGGAGVRRRAARIGYVANRAHHADVGGSAPGSMPVGVRARRRRAARGRGAAAGDGPALRAMRDARPSLELRGR